MHRGACSCSSDTNDEQPVITTLDPTHPNKSLLHQIIAQFQKVNPLNNESRKKYVEENS